jgi:phage shock protein PspC (stress-responsive transcriptional regulator)
MRRVETISINGILFRITDDAFRNLNDYLNSLYEYFGHEQDGNEIINDIEARIAELFTERNGGGAQAITNKDVMNVIETLGTLKDITDLDNEDDNRPSYSRQKRYAKRLYRNNEDNIVGGVCAGIAAWLDINVIIVRLGFIICCLMYGIAIPIYLLLWIIIPLARTTAQKLEMKGQPVNISNIERSIRGNMSVPRFDHSSDRFANDADNSILKGLWKLVRVLAGSLLCLFGIGMVISFVTLFILHDFILERHLFPFNRFTPLIYTPSYNIILICTIVFAVLTIAACIYWGIKAIMGTKVKYPAIHITLLVIWFLMIPITMGYFVRETVAFSGFNKSINTINLIDYDTIYLKMYPSDPQIPDCSFDTYFDNDNNCFYGRPEIYIRKSNGKSKLQIVKIYQGRNNRNAIRHANNIDYKFDIRNSQITLASYFTVQPVTYRKKQSLDVFLYISEDTVLIIDEALCNSDVVKIHMEN